MAQTVVSSDEWLAARKELLAKEKEFTRLRDELTKLRQDLPWEKVEKDYVFEGVGGRVSLAELFDGRSQLVVYHFMFGPDWPDGCKSCSLCADHYDPLVVHMNQRDVSLVTVSRAPSAQLEAFKQRMGWSFNWVSSLDSEFNWDYNVSFTPEALEKKEMHYNYRDGFFPSTEGPGVSVFAKNDDGEVFHTYSAFARGLEVLLGVYHWLDLVPKGRDESSLTYGMEWVRHHDKYDAGAVKDHYVQLMAD